MTPADIIALGQSLYGPCWIQPMAADIGYSCSQLWRVAYDGAPITNRMRRELAKLAGGAEAGLTASPSRLQSGTSASHGSTTMPVT